MKAAALAGLAAAALAGAGGAAAAASPTVRIVTLTPALKVRGAHFVPAERVHVTVYAGNAKRAGTVRASATGAFTVQLGTLARSQRCGPSISIVAAGTHGDRALYKLPQLECPDAQPDQATSSGT